MRKRSRALGSMASAALVLGSIGAAGAKTLEAVASFTVLADVVSHVGGTHVHVTSLVGPNGDPHVFEPSPTDAKHLKAADVAFVSGLGLEGWMDRLISASGYKGAPVVASAGIASLKMEDEGKTVTDPHVWNDAASVLVWIKNIEAALAAADPADAADFKANAAEYTKDIEDLDTYAKGKLTKIPATQRKILTSHDAFGYFGKAYGVTFLSPQGVSTESEASAATVAKLIEQIKAEHVKVYFLENSNDPRLLKQVADATGAKAGGTLYVESLSPSDGPASTYAAMFRYNVDTFAAAMQLSMTSNK